MVNRFFLFSLVLLITGTTSVSCSEDIPDCPSRMCVVAGGWMLTKVYVDNELYTGDLSQYRLTLNMPSPTTATASTFERIQPSGASDDGSWTLINDETVLRLLPNDEVLLAEDWIIESMTPRQMILIINRDVGIKEGPGTIEFILEPF